MIKLLKQLVEKNKQYHFAVSMGVDSVAAYFWMREKGYDIQPLHFNHKLRPQNDRMEQKFRELCDATNRTAVVGYGQDLQTENDCRQARLEFFKNNAENIITAHHLNDYVESYLLNCFRGQPNHNCISLQTEFVGYNVIHPFLLTRKHDLVQYAERNNLLRFVEVDETNTETKGSRRNWIRNTIVPEMLKQKLSLEKFAEEQIKSEVDKYPRVTQLVRVPNS